MSESLRAVRTYHQATKHRTDAYAPGPGFLDWDSQPDPFRRYSGAPLMPLPLAPGTGRRQYDALYRPDRGPAEDLSPTSLGLFLELALGLSAWKSVGPDRWALRNNPSSGNLHPTEGYLLLWCTAGPDLGPGLYHYAPREHALERRAILPTALSAELQAAHPGAFGAFGLSSVTWREEWKYGARAYRYCQHDVGHALAAARYAAGVLGWTLRTDPGAGDNLVAACLGLDRPEDLGVAEAETPDLLAVWGKAPPVSPPPWLRIANALAGWTGTANRLSDERVRWPQIAALLPAVHKRTLVDAAVAVPPAADPAPTGEPGPADACTLIRQRRSAQRMDGQTGMERRQFERALGRTLPTPDRAPFDALPYAAALNLVLFVHRVASLEPGLYGLIRVPQRFAAFRSACAAMDLAWERLPDTALPLYRLRAPLELQRTASALACHQSLAGRGAFSLAMVADLGRVLEHEGAWAYRRLHWEAGMIGQVLYLEAEAAGLRGTGIGCFFDDEVHRLLGLDCDDQAPWQALYQFTVGAPVADRRMTTEPAYAHLPDRCFP